MCTAAPWMVFIRGPMLVSPSSAFCLSFTQHFIALFLMSVWMAMCLPLSFWSQVLKPPRQVEKECQCFRMLCHLFAVQSFEREQSGLAWEERKKNDAGTQCRAIQKDDSYIGQHWARPRWAHIMTCSAHWHSQSCIVLPRRFSFLFSLAPVKIYMCEIFFWWEEEKQWKWQVWKHQDWKPSLHQTFLE